MIKFLFNKNIPAALVCFCFPLLTFGQFSGIVKDKDSSESLIGVSITTKQKRVLGFTNSQGYFFIENNKDTLVFSMIGYEPFLINSKEIEDYKIVYLKFATSTLEEVLVNGYDIPTPEEGILKLSAKELKRMPSLFGEKDLIKVVQTLPGVKRVLEGGSGYSVRGGGIDQNLVLLDNVPLYSYNHLFGLFSMFNTDAVKDIEFLKSGISAAYGGRSSSVLNVRLKDGNEKNMDADASIGLLSSKITINGPLVKDKTTIMFTTRRSYVDLLTKPFMPQNNRQSYVIADVGLKVSHKFNEKNKFFAGYYHSFDSYKQINTTKYSPTSKIESPFQFGWVNSLGYIRYVHVGKESFSSFQVYTSRYQFNYFEKTTFSQNRINQKTSQLDYNSFLNDTGLNIEHVLYLTQNSTFKFGYGSLQRNFLPKSVKQTLQTNGNFEIQSATIDRRSNYESNIYAEIKKKFKEQIITTVGIRNVFWNSNQIQPEYYFEPRVVLTYNFRKNVLFRLGYHKINQFVHLLSNSGGSLPTDLWVTATEKIKPQQSEQLSLGITKILFLYQKKISFEGDIYIKNMKNLLTYRAGTNILNITEGIENDNIGNLTNWENTTINGLGFSRGIEVLVRKNEGKLQGSLSYTLSNTKNKFNDLNNAAWFYPRFDRTHDLTLVTSYGIRKNITINSSMIIASGNPITLPNFLYQPDQISSDYRYKGVINEVPFYSGINNFRSALYHRLDLGIEFRKMKKRITRTWEVSIFNTYANKNPFYFTVARNNLEERNLINFEPNGVHYITIIPSISYIVNLK